jgi:hypothetical protein
MIAGLELVVGYLIAWVTRKARRARTRLDADTDLILDTELDRLHDLIVAKLGTDPALGKLEQDVAAGDPVSDRTRRRVEDALAEATDNDPDFAASLADVLAALGAAPSVAGEATGERSAAAGGDVHISAQGGSAAAQTMGDVTIGGAMPGPSQPGRSGG